MKTRHSEKDLSGEFWDINDLSCYLKIKVKTLYAMRQDIPHYRIGKLIRFRKDEIDNWLEGKRAKKESVTLQAHKASRPSGQGNFHIDNLIRKAIDQTKEEVYNFDHGKPDHIKGLEGKEVAHGLV